MENIGKSDTGKRAMITVGYEQLQQGHGSLLVL